MSYNSVLNVKALVGAFNQEKAQVGFSVIVKTGCGTDGALHDTALLFADFVPLFEHKSCLNDLKSMSTNKTEVNSEFIYTAQH